MNSRYKTEDTGEEKNVKETDVSDEEMARRYFFPIITQTTLSRCVFFFLPFPLQSKMKVLPNDQAFDVQNTCFAREYFIREISF